MSSGLGGGSCDVAFSILEEDLEAGLGCEPVHV